jgi:hypothetical protein
VFGETKAGKTYFINSYINILLGVDYYDPFRFKIIDEAGMDASVVGSRTTSVITYHIPSSWIKQARYKSNNRSYCINIIDSPGFADTRGFD